MAITRLLRAISNKSWRQHPTKQQLYRHLPSIMKTIQVRRTRYLGHRWRSRDELISDILMWTPSPGRAKAGRPARTYILQLCADTGCNLEDLPGAMDDRDLWRQRVRESLRRDMIMMMIYMRLPSIYPSIPSAIGKQKGKLASLGHQSRRNKILNLNHLNIV